MKNQEVSIEKFLGTWELQAWKAETADGEGVFPFGEDAFGRITYDRFGQMAVQIMSRDRSPFLSEDPLQAQPEEVIEAFKGYLAYCGNFEIDMDNRQVVHQIKMSSFPNWVGQNQRRYYEFHGDQLILSTDLIGSSRHQLTWKKVNS